MTSNAVDSTAAAAIERGYLVHRADKVGPNGEASALCFDPPRPIDVRPGSKVTWSLRDATTNCPECLAKIAAMGGRDRPGEEKWLAS